MYQQVKYQCSKCQSFNAIKFGKNDEWRPEDNPNNWIQDGLPILYYRKCRDCGHEKFEGRIFGLTDPNFVPVVPKPTIIEF